MMQENRSKKLFGILNGLDIFIILILLAAIAFGVYWIRGGGTQGGQSEQKTYTYVVEGRQVREEIINFPEEGGNVYDSKDGTYLGKIKSSWATPFCEISFNRVTNQYELLPQPGYSNVYVEIEGTGTETEQDIIVEGNVVKVGAEQSIKGKGFAYAGYIVEVRDGE